MDQNVDTYEFGYVELKFKMNGDSTEFATKLQAHY